MRFMLADRGIFDDEIAFSPNVGGFVAVFIINAASGGFVAIEVDGDGLCRARIDA